MSGSAVISTIDSEGTFTFDGGDAANLAMNIEHVSASAATVTLGAVSQDTHANEISAINVTNAFTLNGSAYREIFTADTISASAVSVTFGDLSDAFSVSAIEAVNFTFAGGDGANFSAAITNASVTGSDWSISMPELGNGLTITQWVFAASGTMVGTNSVDTVSASSTTAAGDTVKFEFNMGEDSATDVFAYNEGSGKSLVKIYNFRQNTDDLKTDHEVGTAATSVGTTTAASIIGGALGASISASDLTAGSATATFAYNGDMFFIGAATGNAINTTFEDGETVFQFVGITDISGGDITQI